MPLDPRVCKVCCVPKPLKEFSLRDGRNYPYRLKTCDPCQKEKDRARTVAYMEKNREKVNERVRTERYIRYHTDPEFREKIKERSRNTSKTYYEKNRERILARRRERRAAKE